MTSNRVKGGGALQEMGPMGKQGRENVLGNIHVREKGWGGQRPTREPELGHINIKLQRTVGRKLIFSMSLVSL